MEGDVDIGLSFQKIPFFQLTTSLDGCVLDKRHFQKKIKKN